MADETLNVNDGTLNVRAGSLGGASMRYHELAVQRWLNGLFFVREGYPVPIVFTSPMDAFSSFQQLWADENNPFSYLFDLKDAKGTPLYEPYPSPVRYPIISVHRKNWKYRSYQNFSIHRWRHINWPTVANAGTERYGADAQGWDIAKCRLGNVTTSRMPMAWDYKFQIDHFCNRPDTQAFFVEQLMQTFWRTGGVPQTWITVPYPGWGNRRVRLYLEGDIESLTPEEPEEGKNVEFRTSFTIVVEGFDIDLRYEIYPALWELILRFGPVAPIQLEDAFNFTKTVDLRISGSNTTLDIRPNVPTWGTCQDLLKHEITDQSTIQMVGLNDTAADFGVFTIIDMGPPQVMVSIGEPVNGTLSISAFGSLYSTVPDVVDGFNGTDALQYVADFGNIDEYQLYNFTNEDSLTVAPFGTHFFALVPGFTGSNDGTLSMAAFGSHTSVTVFVDTGSNSGTLAVESIGTYTEVVVSFSGSDSGTFSWSTFGTHLEVIEHAGTFANNGTFSVTAFGTYI